MGIDRAGNVTSGILLFTQARVREGKPAIDDRPSRIGESIGQSRWRDQSLKRGRLDRHA
jgi:hypothetical protein